MIVTMVSVELIRVRGNMYSKDHEKACSMYT